MNIFYTWQTKESLDQLVHVKLAVPIVLLAVFWVWETWRPFFGWRGDRWRHAARNLALALGNTFILSLAFATVTVLVAEWTARNQFGLLHLIHLAGPLHLAIGLVLLDGWMYAWHRANHTVPFLWRFHRMHHSDNRMDVTTATRFHLGEHIGGSTLRLGVIALFGVTIWQVVLYDVLVIAVTQFHHADISLGRWDRWLRLVIVTPDMHKMHHSRWRPETDSNYSVLFSAWDRITRTFRMRQDLKTLDFGLDDFDDRSWQTLWGMLKTPFFGPARGLREPDEAGGTAIPETFSQTSEQRKS